MLDVVAYLLELMVEMGGGEQATAMFLDFVDAFFLVPLRKGKYNYLVSASRGAFHIWLRVAQELGSTGSAGGCKALDAAVATSPHDDHAPR